MFFWPAVWPSGYHFEKMSVVSEMGNVGKDLAVLGSAEQG